MNMMRKSEKGTKKRSFTDRLKNSLQGWKDSGAQRKKHMVRAGTALACIVAFTTTYALILPAITLDRTPQCGQEEHIHTEDCYAIVGLAEGATQTSAAGTADVAELSADGLPVADLLSADVPAMANGSGSETNAFAAAMRQAGLDEFVIRNLISDTTLADSLAAEFRHGESAAENAGHSASAVADAANASDADDAAGVVGTVRNGSTTNPADASDAHPAEGRRVLICGLEEHHHSRECYTANDTDADASGDILTDVSSADPADSTEAETGSLTDPAADARDAADAAGNANGANPSGAAASDSSDETSPAGEASVDDADGTDPSGDTADFSFDETNPTGDASDNFDETNPDGTAAADDSDEIRPAGSPAADGDLAAASDDADRIDGDRSDNENGDNNLSGSEAPEALHDTDPADSAASDTTDPAANGTPDDTDPAADNASDNTGAADGRVTDDADSSNGNAPAGTNPAGSDASEDVDPADGNASDDTDPVGHVVSTTADPSATGDLTADGQSENATAGSGSLHGNGGASSYNQESSTADATLSGDSDRPEDTSVPEALKNGQKKYNFLIRVRDAIANFVSTGWRRTAEVSGTAISAEYDKGVLPETALMKVHTVDPEPYSDLIAEVTGKENTRIKAFDLSFRDGSEEVEPDGTVKVTFKADFIDEKTTPQVIHITDDGHAEIIPADVTDGKITLTADSFSVYAISYTVDFSYGDYQYSMPGGEKIKLSELVEVLGIMEGTEYKSVESFMEAVESVDFSDTALVLPVKPKKDISFKRLLQEYGVENQFSAQLNLIEKLTVLNDTMNAGEWYLISLKPFYTAEKLTITLLNGEQIVVDVTDAASEATDVSTLLTDVTIDAKMENGKYVLYKGQPYSIHLTFKEQNKENMQFPMNGFSYSLPAGLVSDGAIGSGSIPITLSGGDHPGEIVNLNYTISGGTIHFTWDKTTNPGAYDQLANALYSQFKLDLDCVYDGDSGTLKFSDTISKDVTVKTSGQTYVEKKGNYNAATNSIDYEVRVRSEGITKNVKVEDTISGTALTYNRDATATSSIYGKEIPAPSTSGNGFSFTIPQMADGEVVTIKYSAAVDLSKVSSNENGTLGTVKQTGNKVTVKSDGDDPGDQDEKSGKDFGNKISYSTISKGGTAGEPDETTGHATINWTIKANENANVSMAGHTISDSIDTGSRSIMKYNGDGIYVTAYYENGTVAYSNQLIPWSQLNKTDSTWSWTVPNQYPDNQKLSYEISYTTDVNVSDRIIKTNVSNTATSDNGGTSTKGVDVPPPGGGVTARKKVVKTDLTSDTITWEISFDVPENGLNSAQIVDSVPTYYNTAGQLVAVDNYQEGTISISPELAAGESYEVSTVQNDNGTETVTIIFYKTENEQKVTGLSGTGVKRKIRVQFQTEIDAAWKAAAISNPNENNALYHTNTANVIVNGQTIGTSATTRVDGSEPGMSKAHGSQTKYQVNGNELPAFPFVVTLQGVSEDSFDETGKLIVEDSFNSKYLAYYPETQYNNTGDNDLVGYVYGADNFRDISKKQDPIHNVKGKSASKVVTSPEGGKILITIDRENIPVDGEGNFYPYYYVYYYLTVKDPIALEKLENAIAKSDSGVYQFINTVTNREFGTTTDEFEFEIPVLDKSIIKPEGKSGKLNDYVYYENGNYMVDYQIVVNPDGVMLGDDEEMTLTDDYENIAVDYTTIKIKKYENGSLVDTSSADGVSWNRKGNRVTYTLKNGVHYVITYSARITGEPNAQGKVTYSNTAEYFGVKDWESHEQEIKSGGEGGSVTYGITVFKHAKGAASTPLEGAKFELYRYGEQGASDSWKNPPEAEMDDHTGWTCVKTITTDAQGVAKATGLAKTTWYKLVETQAPTVNGQEYQKKTFAYVFWINEEGKPADYTQYVYMNDDVVAIDNEPVLPETVDIGVTKVWSGQNDLAKRKDITVRLYADGVPYDLAKDSAGNPLASRGDTVKVLELKDDGTTDGYTWTGLPSGPVYSVVEDNVPGYTTSYSSKGMQVSGTINITNKYIPDKTYVHVEKNWDNGISPSDYPEDITVQLKRKVSANTVVRVIRHDGKMIEYFTVPVGSNVTIQYRGTQRVVESQYSTKSADIPSSELYTGDSVNQDKLINSFKGGNNGFTNENDHIVTYDINGIGSEGVTLRFPEEYNGSDGVYSDLASRFTQTPTVNFVAAAGGSLTEDDNFNNENHYYTISAANNWKIDIDRLVKEDDDGKYIYYIEEVGVNDNTQTPDEAGYTVSYENNAGIEGGTGNSEQDTIKVTNSAKPGALEITKKVSGTDAKKTYRIAVKGTNGHYYDVDGTDKGETPSYVSFSKDTKQKWNNLPAGTYTIEEDDASITGYTWRVTGTGDVEIPVGETAKVEVTNFYEEAPDTGSLKITKSVTINGSEPNDVDDALKTKADGTYTFKIYNAAGTTELTQKADEMLIGDLKITVTGGVAESEITVDGLKPGNYVIKETESTNDKTSVDSTVTGYDSAKDGIVVTVVAGDTSGVPTAAFTNKYSETEITVKKTDFTKMGSDRFIAGAKFSLYKVESTDLLITNPVIKKAGSEDAVSLDGESKFEIPVGGIVISGLQDGSYKLVEREAPAGYIISNNTTTFTVSAGQVTEWSLVGEPGTTLEIPNEPGVALPSTGGIGTHFFTIFGSMLIVLSGAMLIVRRRRKRS